MSSHTAQRWADLPSLIDARCAELGIRTYRELGERAGISRAILANIMRGRRTSYHPLTIARLELALLWAPGSISDVLSGGRPTPIDRTA
jgi:transcriptional regulator with XRE-family HTH domain